MKMLTIRTRVIVGFAVLFAFLIAVSVIGVQRVGVINAQLTEINDVNSVKQRHAITFRGSVYDRAIAIRDVILFVDASAAEASIAEIRRLSADYAEAETALNAILDGQASVAPEEMEIITAIQDIASVVNPAVEETIEYKTAGRLVAARSALVDTVAPAFTEWLARINVYIDYQEALNRTLTAETRAIGSGFVNVMLIATFAALAIGLALGVWIIRSVGRLRPVTAAMTRLADGDAEAQTPEPVGADEVADIARALRVFQDNARVVAEMTAEREEMAE